MLFYKLFSSLKIDGAVNFLSRQDRVRYFLCPKNTRLLNFQLQSSFSPQKLTFFMFFFISGFYNQNIGLLIKKLGCFSKLHIFTTVENLKLNWIKIQSKQHCFSSESRSDIFTQYFFSRHWVLALPLIKWVSEGMQGSHWAQIISWICGKPRANLLKFDLVCFGLRVIPSGRRSEGQGSNPGLPTTFDPG